MNTNTNTNTDTDAVTPSTRNNSRAAMTRHRLAAGFVVAGLVLSACGSDDPTPVAAAESSEETDGSSNADASSGEAVSSSEAVSVSVGSTDAGDVLVDGSGLSLYGFLPDEGGTPTCGGGCAEAWPPVLLPTADLPDGLDAGVFSVVDGLEGDFQLVAGGWPLYRFAGDAAAGDITGQGSGDNWFLVAPDGSLITGESAAPAESDGYAY